MIDAEEFYARMPKPDAPQPDGILGAAQEAQDRVEPAAGNSARQTPEATPEPSDVPAEPTAAEIDEQRRQQEAAMANSLYDLPMDPDGPRYSEPTMDRFTAEIPDDLAAHLGPHEGEAIAESFIAAGIGHTQALSFVKMGIEASRNGPLTSEQIQQRNTDGMKVLQQRWGDRTGEKIQAAKAMIKEATARWPGLPEYLERTGLGSDPRLIQQLVARAERRPGRR
jgi:hypothetical protein